MPNPTIVDIPHSLGRAEARRRLLSGSDRILAGLPGGGHVNASWPSEDRMIMTVTAMGQTVDAVVDVQNAIVRVSLTLPPMLSFMSGVIAGIVRRSGQELLLSKPGA